MATKEQPQPENNVAQPEASAPAMPAASYQTYPQYAAYVDPNKGKSKLLTFEYAFAMGSAVAAAFLLIDTITSVFGLWAGVSQMTTSFVGGYLSPDMVTPGTGIVAAAVLALLSSVLSFVLFSRVSKTVPEREGYTNRTAYKLITYGGLGALLLPAVGLVAKLVSILVNSLLFIGVSGAGEIYKSLYLGEFLPYLLALAVVSASLFFVHKIVQGKNASKTLTLVLVAASAVVLLAGAITMAVKLHGGTSSRSSVDSGSSNRLRLQKNFESYVSD